MEPHVPCIHVGCTSISHLFYSKERSHFDDLLGWTIFSSDCWWFYEAMMGSAWIKKKCGSNGQIDPNCPAPNVGHLHLCLQRPSNRNVPRWSQVQMLYWIPTCNRPGYEGLVVRKICSLKLIEPTCVRFDSCQVFFDSLMQELLQKNQHISLPLLRRCFQLKFPIELPYSSKNMGTQTNPEIRCTG